LNHLSEEFVSDLLEKSKPIGTLWLDYKMETFKEMVKQEMLISDSLESTGFIKGMEVLSRTYDVFNNKKRIMRITENFPCELYNQLLF
jgi:chorismate-pyruvate lyase